MSAPVATFTTDLSSALDGTFDPEARFASFPPHYTIKGVFFTGLVAMLGDRFDTVAQGLSAPPRLGRYLPFRDYPQVDYSRVTHAAVKHCFPDLPLREAARRVARNDFAAFASSTVGTVMLSVMRDPSEALLRFPEIHRLVLRGGRVDAEPLSPHGIRLEYRDFLGWVDCYVIGTLEGAVGLFGATPTLDVTLFSDRHARYDVRWT